MKNDFMTNQIYLFPLLMDKEESDRLSKELWELSEDVDKNIERMKEIAHVLVTYYMWWKWRGVKFVEKNSQQNDQKNTV